MDANQPDIVTLYNYDSFVPEKFERWLRFAESPPLGRQAPDLPLWELDGRKTRLSEVWCRHGYTLVEFGSFT